MIEIRYLKDSDSFGVDALLKKNGLSFLELQSENLEFYIVSEGTSICGLCGFKVSSNTGVISFIFINPQDRGFKFGDGLFRGVLNYMDHKGVETVSIKSNAETNGFYVSEGLEIAYTDPGDTNQLIFQAKLPEFFNKPCKGSSR